MKVNLIKEAVYELNEKKNSQVPFDVFVKMASVDVAKSSGNTFPKVRIFENIEEFKTFENFEDYDTTKDVHILKNGNICVFLKEDNGNLNQTIEDGTTHTEENTGKES